MAVYLAGHGHCHHLARQRSVLLPANGAGICGCDIEVQGSGFKGSEVQEKGLRVQRSKFRVWG